MTAHNDIVFGSVGNILVFIPGHISTCAVREPELVVGVLASRLFAPGHYLNGLYVRLSYDDRDRIAAGKCREDQRTTVPKPNRDPTSNAPPRDTKALRSA